MEKIDEKIGNFFREFKCIKENQRDQLHLEQNNFWNQQLATWLDRRLGTAEDRLSRLTTVQKKTFKLKRKEREKEDETDHRITNMREKRKKSNIYMIWILEVVEKERKEALPEELSSENFPKLMKDINPQT